MKRIPSTLLVGLFCLLITLPLCLAAAGSARAQEEDPQRVCMWVLWAQQSAELDPARQMLEKGMAFQEAAMRATRQAPQTLRTFGRCATAHELDTQLVETLRSLDLGEVSQPVQIQGGWALVQRTTDEHRQAGRELLRKGSYAEAEEALKADLALHPASGGVWRLLAMAQTGQGKNEDALASLDRGLEWDERNPSLLNDKASLLMSMGQKEKALELFELAHAGRPDDPAIMNNLAWALAELNRDLDRAEKLAQTSAAKLPNTASAWDTLGRILSQRGKKRLAVLALHRALKLSPDNQDIRQRMMSLLVDMDSNSLASLSQAGVPLGDMAPAEPLDPAGPTDQADRANQAPDAKAAAQPAATAPASAKPAQPAEVAKTESTAPAAPEKPAQQAQAAAKAPAAPPASVKPAQPAEAAKAESTAPAPENPAQQAQVAAKPAATAPAAPPAPAPTAAKPTEVAKAEPTASAPEKPIRQAQAAKAEPAQQAQTPAKPADKAQEAALRALKSPGAANPPRWLRPLRPGESYFIQAGSFQAEELARREADRWNGHGAPVLVRLWNGGKTPWYQVLVGPYADAGTLMAALEGVDPKTYEVRRIAPEKVAPAPQTAPVAAPAPEKTAAPATAPQPAAKATAQPVAPVTGLTETATADSPEPEKAPAANAENGADTMSASSQTTAPETPQAPAESAPAAEPAERPELYFIHVSSHGSLPEAEAQRREWRLRGQAAWIRQRPAEDHSMLPYQVLLGPYDGADQARARARELAGQGLLGAYQLMEQEIVGLLPSS